MMKNKNSIVLTLLFAAALFSSCTSSPDPSASPQKARNPASSPRQPAAELGETWTAQDEINGEDAVASIQRMLLKRTGGDALMKRDAHPKQHGCVKAFFKIDAKALAPQDRVGLFAHDGEELQAWVRFSNGDPDSTKADDESDVRGMAIKIMGLSEPNFLAREGIEPQTGVHDIVMMNSPVFFIKDTKDYAELMHAVEKSTVSLGWFMLTHPTTALILQKARGMNVGNPLHVDYFSATPYKLGTGTMKFSARSCVAPQDRDKKPAHAAHDFLRDRLISTLKVKDDSCFDFLVQKGTQGPDMPIELPTADWSTETSPYVKVATLRIPKQDGIDSEAQMNFCENLSFNPWRALPENRPLGAINRVRLLAYGQISDLRHEHNHVPVIQPKSHEICEGETAPLCHKP